jgi:hypothetical protein
MKAAIGMTMTLSLAVGLLCGIAFGQQPPPIPAQEQPEVLTRGPVHEAFAEPVILQNQAGLVVTKQPPANIEEVPPAERPEGDHYVWIPGYWSWDEDRNDFIWVSACWRAAPPNMTWVPGYWSQVSGGWEWVAGFWTSADDQEMEYLPTPPTVEDVEAPGEPPSSDDIWVPPCPYWDHDQYVMRPGYWLAERPDWVWVPSYYVWTPRGYFFCNGHWDYPLEDRGILFAPVYFPSSVYLRPGFTYTPTIVLDLSILTTSLFTYPRYCHYYFGDYYADAYLNVGIFPWFDVGRIHTWYDPIYVYDRWNHRRDERGWEEQQRNEYDRRRGERDLRPPRTYHEMEVRRTNKSSEQQNNFRMAEPYTELTAARQTKMRFEHINSGEQKKITTQATAVHAFGTERNHWESTRSRQEIIPPPPEQRGTMTPPSEHQEPVTRPEEHRGYIPPPEHTYPATPPPGPEERTIQPRETPFVPPHEVHIYQPERVQIPPPPFVGRQSSAGNPPPPRPMNEGSYQRETPRENQGGGNKRNKGR